MSDTEHEHTLREEMYKLECILHEEMHKLADQQADMILASYNAYAAKMADNFSEEQIISMYMDMTKNVANAIMDSTRKQVEGVRKAYE